MSSSLILATGSEFKVDLLSRLDLAFTSVASKIDESARSDETPRETARRLALAKARAIHDDHPEAWVLGADQTIALDGDRFRKPGTVDAAIDQLRRLAGRTHRLTCAVGLVTPAGDTHRAIVDYEMEMRQLTDRTIREYVDRDRPLACAGAYKIEQGGIRLFRAMRGDDYTAIVGLPLTRVWNILDAAGYFSQTPRT
ncbi:MAG: nucleoside triphosphate pyrophosphatase [Bradymonadaceae bacterium]